MSYRVKTVCGMTGIPRPTLLAWERRYEILEPRRSPTGHRIYTDEDVAVLRDLKQRVDAGFSISEAVRLQREARQAQPAGASTGQVGDETVERLLRALADYDRDAADRLSVRLRQLTFQQVIDEVYLPLLKETGDAWARGDLSVAQEHFVSGWVGEQLQAIFHGLGSGPAGGPTAVCALAPNELHQLGMLSVAIHLMLSGWRVTWLGADLPVDELCRFVEEERPDLVCLSVTSGHTPEQVRSWALALRDAAPTGTTVAVGGPCATEAVDGVLFPRDGRALLDAVRRAR
ncbi:MAG: cobalamin B12-binding domain-containing protein [Alphaproteobacteria bacterium]|nr:cobalamin B12-binding domain-containing protein [Alphaproteobacteria bacterium]